MSSFEFKVRFCVHSKRDFIIVVSCLQGDEVVPRRSPVLEVGSPGRHSVVCQGLGEFFPALEWTCCLAERVLTGKHCLLARHVPAAETVAAMAGVLESLPEGYSLTAQIVHPPY